MKNNYEAPKGLSPESQALYDQYIKDGVGVIHIDKNQDLASWAQSKGILEYIGRRRDPFNKDAGNEPRNILNGLANPYVLADGWGNQNDGNRKEVIIAFAMHLKGKKSIHDKAKALDGKILACHCQNKLGKKGQTLAGNLCHGHVLKEVAQGRLDLGMDLGRFADRVTKLVDNKMEHVDDVEQFELEL